MMLAKLLLLASLFHHHPSKQDQARQHEIDAMTKKAAVYVMRVRMATNNIEENCNYIPQSYFDAMHRDLNKIALDRDVSAPSFRQDFDDLADDFYSLLFAITTYKDLANS